MPYIMSIRSDIPEGALQVLDLQPNTSQRNPIYNLSGQTKYLRVADNDTVATRTVSGAVVTSAEYRGLAAWLLDNIEDGVNNDALTAAQANSIAALLISRPNISGDLDLVSVNVVIALIVTGSGIGVGASTGTLADLLDILAGAAYVLPAGSIVDTDGSTFNPTPSGTLSNYRHTYSTGAFSISAGEGQLYAMSQDTFTYGGVAGAAVVIYNDDGTVA